MSTQKCPAVQNGQIQCVSKNGQSAWQVTDSTKSITNGTCPSDSIPWRLDALCATNKTAPICYSTQLENQRGGAVCVTGMDNANVSHTSIREPHALNYTKLMDGSPDPTKFTPCHVQPFENIAGAQIVSYVEINDTQSCDKLYNHARDICVKIHGEHKCTEIVPHIYRDTNHQMYQCELDTNNLPVGNQSNDREWWKWLRTNTYPCRDGNWTCNDEKLTEYEGGRQCDHDAECTSARQTGVCDLKQGACLHGSVGSRCKTHEHCDIIAETPGVCTNSRCTQGDTQVKAVYRVPQEAARTLGDLPSKHVYCGLTSNGEYTGTRQPFEYKGETHHGCKSFDSPSEIYHILSEETDWQARFQNRNVHDNAPPWERLVMCAETDKIRSNGQFVCKHTTYPLQIDSGHVSEISNERASKTCATLACEAHCTPGLCVRDTENKCKSTVNHKATKLPPMYQPSIPVQDADEVVLRHCGGSRAY